MDNLEIKNTSPPVENTSETARPPGTPVESAEISPPSPERALESGIETLEVVDAKKQDFQGNSVTQTAEVLGAYNLSAVERQAVMDENHVADQLADLDSRADQMAGTAKQRIAEKMRDLLITEQEGFDPEKALQRIRHLPREQKGAAMSEYKSELAKQKLALSQLHTRLEEKIRENPDMEFSELWQEVRRADDINHFSVHQSDTIAEILHTYKAKHEAVRAAAERFQDNPEGLYEFAMGAKPKGKVRAEIGPMSINFVCGNFDDYALAHHGPEGRKKARTSKGLSTSDAHEDSLAGTLTFEKNTLMSRVMHAGRAKGVAAHEEQHAIHRLFTDVKIRRETLNESMKKASTVEEKAQLFASYIRTVRWNCLPETKDEVLAYIKGGTGKSDTLWTLAHSNLYRHMEAPIMGFELWAKKNAQEFSAKAQDEIKKVFTTEYRQIMKDGYESYEELSKMGKTKEEALALLEHEPLQRWPKVVERLKRFEGQKA